MTDALETIFAHQKEYIEKYIVPNGRFPTEIGDQIDKLMTAVIHEAVELQRLTNWKWWKQPVQLNIQLAREELVDILHFIVHAAITLNMDHEQVLFEYLKKNKINRNRQEQGY